MIVHRCFTRQRGVASREPGGPLWIAREHQGAGRHDNPTRYGCLYVGTQEIASVVELLAPLKGRLLHHDDLGVHGAPLAVAAIELDEVELIDLDDPRTLARERLRPSLVATRERELTQRQALTLFQKHPRAAGLRWWSRFESQWINLTLFDRASRKLDVLAVRDLKVDDPTVLEAAEFLEMQPA